VDEVAAGPDASALTRAIVQLGQTLRLVTVAEGIETAEQLAELRESGCQLGQGHYFATSLERTEVEALLLNGSRKDQDLLLLP
jgi:EAL domain-containing protein (putative c-di-GMP-specific phosphodiesterase class I)